MHKLLRRQIRRSIGSIEEIPATWQKFIDLVDTTYYQSDEDRLLLERSLDLASDELIARNQTIRRERDFVTAIMDTAGALIMVLDREGRIVRFNPACEHLIGYTFTEVEGQRFWDLFPLPEERHEVIAEFQDLLKYQGVSQWEGYWRTRFGDKRLITWSTAALTNASGQVEYMIGTGMDITERKVFEKALRRSEERLRVFFEEAPIGITMGDIPENPVSVNKKLATWLGYEAQDLESIPAIEFVKLVTHPDDLAREIAFLEEAMRHERSSYQMEKRYYRKDGAIVWGDLTTFFIRDEQGQIKQSMSMIVDITERKHAEQQAFELILEKARAQLLTRFIEAASHEFRTPLSVISSSAYLLLKVTNDDKRTLYADRIVDQTQAITHLVNSMLIVSRLDSGYRETATRIDLNMLLKMVLDGQLRLIQNKNLHLELTLDKHLPAVEGVYDDLNIAFEKIIENAVHFTPSGGTITITTQHEDQHIKITVQDTGIGIGKHALPHIFEHFYREDKAHTNRGFGLGLPIARTIIEQHHGRITAVSQPEHGSTFSIILPV